MAPTSVYLLPLLDNGAPDVPGGHSYIHLPPPTEPSYVLRFTIDGTSSVCRHGTFCTNMPAPGDKFERTKFREFKLKPDFNRSIEIDVPVTTAGAFAFYTKYTPLPEFSTEEVSSPAPTKTPTYYVDVSPSLAVRGETLPLDGLSIFSILSKFMGSNPQDWDKHFKGIGQRGYNMVHFTPLVQRGISNSPYSIADQLVFDPKYFPNGESDIERMISHMEADYGLLPMTDVVWNHTANNSKWLEEHPDSGYNLTTAPWLESAELLDAALLDYGKKLSQHGMPTTLNSVADLDKIMAGIKSKVIGGLKLWEYYVADVERDAKGSTTAWREGNASTRSGSAHALDGAQSWSLKQKADWIVDHALTGNDMLGERFRRRVRPEIAASLLTATRGSFSKNADEEGAFLEMHAIMNEINAAYYKEYDADVAVIMDQLKNRIKYLRLDDNGPKQGAIGESSPLIESYFTRLPKNEKTSKHDPRSLALVNNGWIWAADAMKDNAGSSSRSYLKREVIIWGDCVKLRYGTGPQDSPFLWDHMAKYTRLMAKYFQGIRIDNCHSTPIHVAEYMLDQARTINPNCAVFAELFSGSEGTDFVFVKRLGIAALIREAMQAWSTGEMSRLVHMHGGIPIGSFMLDETSGADTKPGAVDERVHRIRQSNVHALLYDCTHDNETPAQKRDARDTLPNAALVAMCACATGSVMGYDEVYPALVDLVSEKRQYVSQSSEEDVNVGTGPGGIGGVKKLLNEIHVRMGKEGYDETYIDHRDQYVTVHRVNPETRHGYFLIAHTAYPGYGNSTPKFEPVSLGGSRAKTVGVYSLEVDASQAAKDKVNADKAYLRGLPSQTKQLDSIKVEQDRDGALISITGPFPPGSIALFETSVPAAEHADGLDKYVTSGARDAFQHLALRHLNFVLYRCEAEERDISDGRDGVYTIPDHGALVYAGLQGWWSVLKDVIRENNLGHPMCDHLRQGPWALDYCAGRLEKLAHLKGYEELKEPAHWLRLRFNAVNKLPSYLRPRYFAMIIQTAYNAAWDRAIAQMSEGVQHGPDLLKRLAMVSVQMSGYMKSASLYPHHQVPCLAAGLPHFAVEWARCWGRDTFISLRGLLLGTGRFSNAREHILAFGSVVKHGMIPNLLSSGKVTRYNSRDSVWFFLQCIQDYTQMAPNGMTILKDAIKRRYLPYDDTWFPWDDERAYSKVSTVEDIIQECLQRHAWGMSFREANAGPGIDSQMSDEGFNIEIHVDWKNGIVFGGNQWNCGTWMDKMGESTKAGNKGYPGSPRDGAAIEITGLLYSTLKWVAEMNANGQYRYDGVKADVPGGSITFKDWAAKIKDNFERCYFVPLDASEDGQYDVNTGMINRRGIYKDLYRSGVEWQDYQLRPNAPIAMTVAPDLFSPEKALHALSVIDKNLRGPTGMATLDPSDLNYRPNYINSDDSDDFRTAKGRNYHSGPEWIWPTGWFLRALLKFDLMRRKTAEERVESYQQVTRRLHGCMEMIKTTPWAGLTELTNQNGSMCNDSSPTQAWSASCIIDLFHDAQQMSAEWEEESTTQKMNGLKV
ncbi:hypothetical protein FH972_020962 [Carpinus fangiana]|uniref:Glycogen debranching enzyme n=1 Tax=Carpinus fangiana TaxID=176857 RepID=A0A5N6KN08_9ROSI|nr:hypothetical protein FH972_020962 [Carpinus fangiana]